MYKKLDLCPSCKHTTFDNRLIAKDHLVSGESFAIVQCQDVSSPLHQSSPQ